MKWLDWLHMQKRWHWVQKMRAHQARAVEIFMALTLEIWMAISWQSFACLLDGQFSLKETR